jgi:uncharacterized protein YegP (UPF0339 family)
MKPTHTLTIYKARDGWRWRLVAKNGHCVADSGEAYTRRSDALRAALRFPDAMAFAEVVS